MVSSTDQLKSVEEEACVALNRGGHAIFYLVMNRDVANMTGEGLGKLLSRKVLEYYRPLFDTDLARLKK